MVSLVVVSLYGCGSDLNESAQDNCKVKMAQTTSTYGPPEDLFEMNGGGAYYYYSKGFSKEFNPFIDNDKCTVITDRFEPTNIFGTSPDDDTINNFNIIDVVNAELNESYNSKVVMIYGINSGFKINVYVNNGIITKNFVTTQQV
jgi:hypothetical protein